MFENIDRDLTPASHRPGPPSYVPHSVSTDRSFTAFSVQSRNSDSSNDVIGSDDQTVIPHSSIVQGLPPSFNDSRAPSVDSSQFKMPALHPLISTYARSSFDGHQPPGSRTQGTTVSPSPFYNPAESPRNEGRPKSHAQISALCDVIRAMSKEWIQRLALSTNIPQLSPDQDASALFELGIRVLRNYFRGATPSSFEDIFALMHVAVASSYIARKDDHAYSWDTSLYEAFQWQHLLSDVIEKGAFVKVMSRLCDPHGSTTSSSFQGLFIDDVLLPAEQATLVRLVRHLSSTGVDVNIQEEGDKSRIHSTTDIEQIGLPGTLQSNMIIKGCTEFLDNFGHAIIVEDLANRHIHSSLYIEQHVPGIEMLDSNIIGRLQEWEGLEVFHGVVTETQNMLRRGLLHSARDVEVMLVWVGKSYSKSPQLLQKYLNVVKNLCDTVMQEWGLHWRNHFYEIILGTVLATASEFSHCRGHALQIPPATPLGNLNVSCNAHTPTASTAIPIAELDASSSSSSYSRQTSLARSEDASYCPDQSCKASFTGTSQRTNLERHKRTALHHNQDARFKCEVCHNPFSRSDNLQQHLRNIHGLDPASKGQRTSIFPKERPVTG